MICEAVARSASPEAAAATATVTAKEIWGTWEDLLLACAVSRLGARTWDSVAAEVRSRSPAASSVFTPDACRRRYRHLQNRFSAAAADDDDEADTADEVPWLEELRKIRVAELRREVQRSDVSIGSLQLKAKRLKEEREQTLRRAAANGERVSDLKLEDDHKDVRSPGSAPADQISGGDSGRSCKESNSTDPKGGGNDGEKPPPPPPREAADDPCLGGQGADLAGAAGEEKSAGESSYNGSSDTIARGAAAGRSPLTESSPALPQEVGESGESFAESKDGEAEGAKESSDVQSSAGLSRRRRGRRRKAVPRLPGGERELDAASAWAPVESQPLLAFLEIICSHECGFVFESRLKSQESAGYRGLVLRHVDLEMVRGRIMAGGYARAEFFRDLLLICNNAIVYFAKGSPESTAAVKLRQLVNKEISATLTKPSSPLPPPPPQPEAKKEATPPPSPLPLSPPPAPKLKPEADLVRPSKPGPLAAPPMIACKKRSSIATKPALMKKERDTKEERETKKATESKEEERDNKNERETKKEERDMNSADTVQKENGLPKEKAKERTVVAGTRGPRTNKSRGNKGGREMGKSLANPKPVATSTAVAAENSTPEQVGGKAEKKGAGGAATVAKKRSAAIFLDRLNRVSPTAAKRGAASSKGALVETLKSSAGNGNGGAKGTEHKKGGGGRKEQEGHQGSAAAKHAATEQNAVPVKRSVGRPPKRVAPPPVPPPAKRTREEKRATLPPSRKRTRR